jgi:hypothetical protein
LAKASCPSPTFCAVAGADGIWTSTNPGGGPSAWRRVWRSADNGLDSLSCPTSTFCVAVGGLEAVVSTTGRATGGFQAGYPVLFRRAVPVQDGTIQPVLSCMSTAPCRGRYQLDAAGVVLRGTYNLSLDAPEGPIIKLAPTMLARIRRQHGQLRATLRLTPTEGGRPFRWSIVITRPSR